MRRLLVSSLMLGGVMVGAGIAIASEEPPRSVAVVIEAGEYDRVNTPVSMIVNDVFWPGVRKALDKGPVGLRLSDGDTRLVAQVERLPGEAHRYRVAWVQPGKLKSKTSKRLTLDVVEPVVANSPWIFHRESAGAVELFHGKQPVFRYNAAPVLASGLPEIQRRDAYLHPVYTPTGVLATGDFSKFHTHHRGIFLAYAKMKVKGEVVDVWNIHSATIGGKIHHRNMTEPVAGPVTARFSADHAWETKKKTPFLNERWDVEVYDVPGSPYWLFDITSTQTAIDNAVELTPYRYGGMAYRGPEPFVKGKLDVLTSEGHGRVDGDQKPARWVDLTGPIWDGSKLYAGAMIADHPGNINHPTVARIHPTSLPFFSYVPAHEKHNKPVTLEPGKPMTFRYRVLVHDGHPSADLDESVWRDFAKPPVARLATGADFMR